MGTLKETALHQQVDGTMDAVLSSKTGGPAPLPLCPPTRTHHLPGPKGWPARRPPPAAPPPLLLPGTCVCSQVTGQVGGRFCMRPCNPPSTLRRPPKELLLLYNAHVQHPVNNTHVRRCTLSECWRPATSRRQTAGSGGGVHAHVRPHSCSGESLRGRVGSISHTHTWFKPVSKTRVRTAESSKEACRRHAALAASPSRQTTPRARPPPRRAHTASPLCGWQSRTGRSGREIRWCPGC